MAGKLSPGNFGLLQQCLPCVDGSALARLFFTFAGFCPDRRIGRLCITCCWPSQPSHHAEWPTRSRLRRQCDGFLVAFALGDRGPCHSCDLVGERDRGDLRGPPRQQRREPGPMFRATDLGIADDGQRASGEQAAQIAISPFADTAELVPPSARVLLRHEPDPGREIPIQSILRQSRSAKASLAQWACHGCPWLFENALTRRL